LSKIEFLNDKLKFYRTILLAIATGVVIVFYDVVNKKVSEISVYFGYIGILVLTVYVLKAKMLENEIEKYLGEENGDS